MKARPEARGTWEYTWEGARIRGSEMIFTIELAIDWLCERYIPAKINCDPDDGHAEEGGGVFVEGVKVTEVSCCYGLPRDPKLFRYWGGRFEKEIEPTSAFKEELSDNAAMEDDR